MNVSGSGRFSINLIQDDPERIDKPRQYKGLKDRGVGDLLMQSLMDVHLNEVVPSYWRGECRKVLRVIKRILIQYIVYHLRLEVAYYNDRYARPREIR